MLGIDDKSEGFQAIKLREALDEAMPALVRAGVSHELRTTRDLREKMGSEKMEKWEKMGSVWNGTNLRWIWDDFYDLKFSSRGVVL